jgi:hypothetical protein
MNFQEIEVEIALNTKLTAYYDAQYDTTSYNIWDVAQLLNIDVLLVLGWISEHPNSLEGDLICDTYLIEVILLDKKYHPITYQILLDGLKMKFDRLHKIVAAQCEGM